jgi:hypothetical protein
LYRICAGIKKSIPSIFVTSYTRMRQNSLSDEPPANRVSAGKKSHRAENLSSCSYSAFCAYTTDTHHVAMMSRIGGREEATNSAWRLSRRGLGSRPPWSEGACSLANLPSKTHVTSHNNPQRLSTRCDVNCRQRLPWCPTPGAAAYNSRP